MKIQYMSDLHLEFYKYDLPPIPAKAGDVLVLAGDIHVGTNAIPWIEQCAHVFDKIFYVPGNHEFYGKTMHKIRKNLVNSVEGYDSFDPIPNVTILDNTHEKYEGVNFIGSTLWSKASNHCNFTINDFKRITYKYTGGYGKFKAQEAEALFYMNKLFLKMAIKQGEKNVIITHHAPSFSSSKDMFLTNQQFENTTAFATDILYEFKDYDIDAWIHGHMHNTSEYVEFGIPVYANPYGYTEYETNKDFSWTKVINVNI